MKLLLCNKCKAYLGEIERGKIKKGTILVCGVKCQNKSEPLNDFMNDILSGRRPKS